MVKEGYEIGMLGYEYKDYTELEEEKVKQDIAKAQTAFKKLISRIFSCYEPLLDILIRPL